jgi:energy-coupling factor transporter ATP-binding protein EcfA2
MAINLKTTNQLASNGVKILVYGEAGSGKTRLVPTLPNVVALSAEGGLLSIKDSNTPYIEVGSYTDITDAYEWLTGSQEAEQFESVALDSISEIAEVVLMFEKKRNKDPRAAYGAMMEQMSDLVRSFRDLPGRNVYFSAKLDKAPDEKGHLLYSASMPGKSTARDLPYFFDEVFALRTFLTDEGKKEGALYTSGDDSWSAKDRSGKLEEWEQPDLGEIIRKITA